jgi:hypothetical protein
MGGRGILVAPGIMGKEMKKEARPLHKSRHGDITHIREVVDAIFAAPSYPIDFEDMKLWKIWDGVVGKQIANHAQPSSIKRGTLVVKVSDSVWLQELGFRAHEIKKMINHALQKEAIKKIRFKVGEHRGKSG